jgi:DNA-binding MarR family transcriptional regulator
MTTTTHEDQAQTLALSVVRFGRTLRARRTAAAISHNQLATLSALAPDGPLTAGQLADREHVQAPSISRIVAALHEQGTRHPQRTPHGRAPGHRLAHRGRPHHHHQ